MKVSKWVNPESFEVEIHISAEEAVAAIMEVNGDDSRGDLIRSSFSNFLITMRKLPDEALLDAFTPAARKIIGDEMERLLARLLA
jgi:hypothetical protein